MVFLLFRSKSSFCFSSWWCSHFLLDHWLVKYLSWDLHHNTTDWKLCKYHLSLHCFAGVICVKIRRKILYSFSFQSANFCYDKKLSTTLFRGKKGPQVQMLFILIDLLLIPISQAWFHFVCHWSDYFVEAVPPQKYPLGFFLHSVQKRLNWAPFKMFALTNRFSFSFLCIWANMSALTSTIHHHQVNMSFLLESFHISISFSYFVSQ